MASKYDLIQLIGNKACAAASQLTELVASQPACTNAETWNMGLMVLVSTTVVIAALVFHQRRKNFRDTFMR